MHVYHHLPERGAPKGEDGVLGYEPVHPNCHDGDKSDHPSSIQPSRTNVPPNHAKATFLIIHKKAHNIFFLHFSMTTSICFSPSLAVHSKEYLFPTLSPPSINLAK